MKSKNRKLSLKGFHKQGFKIKTLSIHLFSVFVFKPSSPNPVFSHVAVSEGNVLSSVFIPQSQKNLYEKTTLAWQNASQLYFINKQQELRTVTFEVDSEAAGKQELV